MPSIWKGTLAFGLVNIPVELRTAVRSDHLSFRLLHADDLSPVRYERVCQAEGEPIPWSEIVKGYEYAKGQFVVMTDDDFKAAALETSRTLEITDFVNEAEIDTRYFETPYYLVPTKGGERAYALLREAIRRSGVVGIGKVTIRQKQHLAGIRVAGDALVLELMRFQHELIDVTELDLPSRDAVRPQELKMAEQLIAGLAEPFDPSKYTDEYRANLWRIIQAKMEGAEIELSPAAAAPREAQVIDLMSRLRESLERQRGRTATVRAPRKSAAARERRSTRTRRRRSG
ncbi:MAG TPA: Ku protein [Gemmatimonadaceae bacterium]|nr:Ku protein [Gemmatimonadaceae bacterium]